MYQAMREAGVRLYAISYDDPEALADFADAHEIEYPLLADPESAVIRAFGILNTFVPEEEAEYHGMPFPGAYVTDDDGTIVAKFFENNQIFRPGPERLLRAALGEQVEVPEPATVAIEQVEVRAFLDGPHLVPGLVRDLVIELSVPEGQHLYGEPVPAGLVPTHVTFDEEDGLVVKATEFPPTTPHRLATGEELHVFEGAVVLRTPITVLGGHGRGLDGTESTLGLGPRVVRATVHFQSCDDHACGLPERVPFEVPVTVEPAIIGDFGGPSMRGKKMHGGRHMRRLLARRDSDHETDEENRA